MKQIDHALTNKLQQIVNLKTELQVQKDKYVSLVKTHKSPDILKETRFKIMRLQAALKEKEGDALSLFN